MRMNGERFTDLLTGLRDDGEIYFDDEPEGGKPEWMEKADRKQRNRRSRKTIKR